MYWKHSGLIFNIKVDELITITIRLYKHWKHSQSPVHKEALLITIVDCVRAVMRSNMYKDTLPSGYSTLVWSEWY